RQHGRRLGRGGAADRGGDLLARRRAGGARGRRGRCAALGRRDRRAHRPAGGRRSDRAAPAGASPRPVRARRAGGAQDRAARGDAVAGDVEQVAIGRRRAGGTNRRCRARFGARRDSKPGPCRNRENDAALGAARPPAAAGNPLCRRGGWGARRHFHCTAAKPDAGHNSVIVHHRAARYKLAPRARGLAEFSYGVTMSSSSQKNGVALLDKSKPYRPSDKEPFMNERQREYFRQKLLIWKEEILKEAKETLAHLQAD